MRELGRWLLRLYVFFILFFALLFLHSLVLVILVRRLQHFGVGEPSRFIHDHLLLTMLLLGTLVGYGQWGANLTGLTWFRSKSGLVWEGFRLEKIKPWAWILVSPALPVGLFFWFEIHMAGGALETLSWKNLFEGFFKPNCSAVQIFRIGGEQNCFLHLLFVGTWMAAVGCSLAPGLRRAVKKLICYCNDVRSKQISGR